MITLEQAQAAIEGRKEFVIKQTENTICFDYIIIADDSFSDEKFGWIRRNFRGITFDIHSKKLISLPFHKFYNINQNTESQYNLHKSKKATIYEKVDGTMIHCFLLNDELIASTCRSYENIQAVDALNFIKSNDKLEKQIVESIKSGFTPIFEWVAPHNQIVIFYDKPRLIYLMSRDRESGLYQFEKKYDDKVQVFSINFTDILTHTSKQNFEGYVCHLECGSIFKIKTAWYLERHRSIDILSKPKYKIYEIVLDGCMDDIMSIAPETHKAIFKEVEREVIEDLLNFHQDLQLEFESVMSEVVSDADDVRKRFVEKTRNNPNFSALMTIFSGKKPDKFVKQKLMQRYVNLYPNRVLS